MKKTNPATVYLNSLSPSGRRSMCSLLRTVLNLLKKRHAIERFRWQTLTYADLITIKMKLQEQGKSANTINLTLAAVRGVMKTAFYLNLIKADQLSHIESVKRLPYRTKMHGRSLTKSECKKLINQCARDKSVKGMRDTAILSVMLTTGLRRNEVCNLNLCDFNNRRCQLTVSCSKTYSERICAVTRNVAKRLKQWLLIRGDVDGALFCPILKNKKIIIRQLSAQTIYTIINERAEQASLGKLTPHDLRRTYVTCLLDANVDINLVRQFVGHRDIKTTARYDYRVRRSHQYTQIIFASF